MAIKSFKKGSEERLAPNFRAREFDCPGRDCCTQTPVDEKLVSILQNIREHFGKPVYVTAYRCPTYNAQVANAAPDSYHKYGMAADISVAGVDPLEVAKYAEAIGVLGIGHYDDFVHVDTRGVKSFWYSHNQIRRSTFREEEDYPLEQFVRQVQETIGAIVDGIAGTETLSKTVTLSARVNRTHLLVALVQKRLNGLGYTQVGEADGIAGAKFDAAVKAFQRDNGCVVDGELTAGKLTWKKLLGMG